MAKTLYMETTQVSPEKTATEIILELQKAGCTSISHRYDSGKIIGLSFGLNVITAGCEKFLEFDLPVRVDPVYEALKAKRKGYLYNKQIVNLKQQAERVAWRQLLRWVQAQLAMIEVGMVKTHEVFMPYVAQQVAGGGRQTFFEQFDSQLLLSAGESATKERR